MSDQPLHRIARIEADLKHEDEPCCDHLNNAYGNCFECYNTGHAHEAYLSSEQGFRDASDMAEFIKAVDKALEDALSPEFFLNAVFNARALFEIEED